MRKAEISHVNMQITYIKEKTSERMREETMEANLLKCAALVNVADAGSFTAAARDMGYAQSSLSRMVADLEAEWGMRLVERSRTGVKLTSEGMKIMPHVRRFVAQGDDLSSRIDDMRGDVSGTLRIGTISSVATHWLPRAIASFQKSYPNVRYELLLGDYTEIEEWIATGRVDCGFVRMPCADELDATVIAEDELFVVLPKGHELAKRETVTPRDLCKWPFLSLSENDDVEDAGMFDGLDVLPDIRVTTWDDYSILAMVEAGLGVSVLPGLILKRIPYEVEIRPLAPKAVRTLAFATRDGGYAPLVAQRFADHLKDACFARAPEKA